MSVNLKVTLGTVNYTDWLHVTASKVSDPGTILWETWLDVPLANYNFIIPDLDPENYYVRYYDAPTNVALGTLKLELVVNALSGETILERRFYTVGGAGAHDPADGATTITDPYLVGKNVTGLFKEGFRYLDFADEATFVDTTGVVSVINGTTFSTGERFIVEIKYSGGQTTSSTNGGLYTGTLNVTEATRTLLAADINKRVRLVGTGSTQVITLCTLASIAIEGGYYFDNSCGGTAMQVKLLLPGADRIRYNGFGLASNLFAEFWVSRGEHLLIRKFDSSYWEVITDYKGTQVGEKVTLGYKSHPNTLTENGQLVDGDQYPRLWWWINNVLPSTHKYTVADVTATPIYSFIKSKAGQFMLDANSAVHLFRMPATYGLSEKGLANFENYGIDVGNRPVDYPGGYEDQMLLEHFHLMFGSGDSGSGLYTSNSHSTGGNLGYTINANNTEPDNFRTGKARDTSGALVGGSQQKVKNVGVIYARRI